MSLKRYLRAIKWALAGNEHQRRRVKLECARYAANLFGDFPLSDDYQLWRQDRKFIKDYRRLSPGNAFSQDRKFMQREFAKSVAGIEGAVAECGCYQGASAYFIATALPDVEMHLFDSFEGLSAPDTSDQIPDAKLRPWQAGEMSSSQAETLSNLQGFSNMHIHPGWLPDSLDVVSELRFRMVHIDVDLHAPTLGCLQFFYPRMNTGGVILLDDYGSLICPGAKLAVDQFMQDKPEPVTLMTTGQGLIIKR